MKRDVFCPIKKTSLAHALISHPIWRQVLIFNEAERNYFWWQYKSKYIDESLYIFNRDSKFFNLINPTDSVTSQICASRCCAHLPFL